MKNLTLRPCPLTIPKLVIVASVLNSIFVEFFLVCKFIAQCYTVCKSSFYSQVLCHNIRVITELKVTDTTVKDTFRLSSSIL